MRSSSSQRRPARWAWLLVLILMVSVSLVAPVAAQVQTGQPLPGETEESGSIQAPTETPTPTVDPAPTDEPVTTEEPTATEEPAPTETPLPTEEPTATEEPVTETPDVPTEEPTATGEPVATGEATEEPKEPEGEASPTAEVDSEFAAAALQQPFFDQPTYTATGNSSLTVVLTIPMDGPTTGGTVSMTAPPFTTFTSVSAAPTTGDVTCNVPPIPPGSFVLSGTFAAVGSGSCALTIVLAIQNPPVSPFPAILQANVSAADPLAFFTAAATILISQAPTATLALSLSNTAPLPGATVTVTLTQTDTSVFALPGQLSGDIPPGTALIPGTGAGTCAPPCLGPVTVIESPPIVTGFYAPFSPVPGVVVTLSYQVTVIAAPGTVITFTGTGFANAGPTGPATASLTVAAPPPPAVADDQAVSVPYQGMVDGTVTASGGVPPLSFAITTDPTKGTVSLDPATGVFTYTAGAGQTGTDSFVFTATDSNSPPQSDTGTVTITIGEPAPLVANDQAVTVPFEGSVDGAVTASGGTPPLTYAVTAPPTKGTLILDAATGAFTYTANAGQTGPDSFTFTATDSSMIIPQTDEGTVSITIGEPDALVATTLTITVEAGDQVTGNLADQVSGGIPPYTFSLLTPPSQGTAIVNPDGTFSYTANMDGSGQDSFTYAVTDSQPAPTEVGAAATTTGTVTIVIEAAQPGPSPTPTEEPDDGIVVPGDPDDAGDDDGADDGATDGDDGTGEDTPDGDPVTRLPSTGHGGATGTVTGWSLVLLGVIAVVIAAAISRRPRHR